MKKIEKLTLEEMAAEMRTYEFQKERGYAFVSYSHQDRDKVYPLVLTWLRAGWNIYIDLDFERHGSDSNWVDLMSSTLVRRLCRLGICFKSTDYTYSYAALLELLTMRGNTANDRHGGKLCIDAIALESVPADDQIPLKMCEKYESIFKRMRREMGNTFLTRNSRERDALMEGLYDWLNDPATKAVRNSTVERLMKNLNASYADGYQEFFPYIARLIKNWFESQDLNGNDYSYDSSLEVRSSRFDEVGVERVREPVEVDNFPIPVVEAEIESFVSNVEPPVMDIQNSPAETIPVPDPEPDMGIESSVPDGEPFIVDIQTGQTPGTQAETDGPDVVSPEKPIESWCQNEDDQENPEVQFEFAEFYYNGIGTEQNFAKAVEWYQKAAEQGHAIAQRRLADCYYHGIGVEQDSGKAAEWYYKAVKQGDAEALKLIQKAA